MEKYDARNWTLFFLFKKTKMTPKNLNLFYMTRRIEPFSFFKKYDSKNWTFFFWKMTHRIEPLFMTLFSIWLDFFLQYDSKDSIFAKENYWLKILNLTQKNWTFSWIRRKAFTFLIKLDFLKTFFKHVFFELNFSIWLKEFELLNKYDWKRIESFLKYDSKELYFYYQYDSKNCTFCFAKSLKDFFWIRRQELNLFFFFWKWVKELNIKKKWLKDLNFIEPFCLGVTQWIELFFGVKIWLKELNFFLQKTLRIELFFNMTLRIEPFLRKYDSKKNSKNSTFFSKMTQRIVFCEIKTWLTELNLLFNMTQRIEPIFFFKKYFTQRINGKYDFFKKNDSKNWTFFL